MKISIYNLIEVYVLIWYNKFVRKNLWIERIMLLIERRLIFNEISNLFFIFVSSLA